MYSSLIFIDPFSFLLFIVSIVVQRMMFKCSLNSPSPFIECIHLFLMKYEVIIQCILFLLLFIHRYSMIVSSYIQTSLESAIYETDKNVFFNMFVLMIRMTYLVIRSSKYILLLLQRIRLFHCLLIWSNHIIIV